MSIFQKHVNSSLNLCQIDAGTLHGGAVSGHGGWQVSLVLSSRSSGYIYIYIYIYNINDIYISTNKTKVKANKKRTKGCIIYYIYIYIYIYNTKQI